jgi:hypothetical protein
MDVQATSLLAANAVAVLAPYLSKAAETVVPKAAEDLYKTVKARLSGKPAAEEALEDLKASPADEDAQAALRLQLKKLLVEDEAFVQELSEKLEKAQASGVAKRVSASSRGVAAGGNVSGTVFTGDIKGPVSLGGKKEDDQG